jgi:prepilin-type N-terminal cleavage/methylation domain-containing protein
MKRGGFSLIELMIVVAIIGVIVAIAMPNLLESKKAANESSAVSSLRTIGSAQELYNSRYSSYGTLAQLEAVDMIDSVIGNATVAVSAKSGYYYTMWVVNNRWCCRAQPSSDGMGSRAFRITQDGVLYHKDGMTIGDNDGTPIGTIG